MLNLSIHGKNISIEDNCYFVIKDSGKPVLRNHTLMNLAKQFGLPNPEFEFIESQRAFQADKFSYVVLAKLQKGDEIYKEIGEANHLNCLSDIAKQYPATMAKTRATSRVLIVALGLQGVVYSEDEFDKSQLKKVTTSESSLPQNNGAVKKSTEVVAEVKPKNTEAKTEGMTKEQAGEVPITVGYMAKADKKVKDCTEQNIKWLLGLDSDKYASLKDAIKLYFNIQ